MGLEQEEEEGTIFPRTRHMRPAPVTPLATSASAAIAQIGSAGSAPEAQFAQSLKYDGSAADAAAPAPEVDMSRWKEWTPDPEGDYFGGTKAGKGGLGGRPKVNAVLAAVYQHPTTLREYHAARRRLHVPSACQQCSHLACVCPFSAAWPLLWCFPAAMRKCGCDEYAEAAPLGCVLVLTTRGVCGYDEAGKPVAIDWAGVDEGGIRLLRSDAAADADADADADVDVDKINDRTALKWRQVPSLTCGVGVGLGVPCGYYPCYHEHLDNYFEIVIPSKLLSHERNVPATTIVAQCLHFDEGDAAAEEGGGKGGAEELLAQVLHLARAGQVEKIRFIDYHPTT